MFIKSYSYPFIDSAPLVKSDCSGLSGVYMILNNLDRKSYIGSAISTTPKHNRIYFRFRNHFFHSDESSNIRLKRAIKKYGLQNFSFHILGFFPATETRQEETNFIKKYKPEYNILQDAQSSIGYTHTQETKDKMSAAYSGPGGAERKLKIGELNRGKSFSSETKELMSMAAIERNKSESWKLKQKEGLLRAVSTYSKATEVWDLSGKILINSFVSAKEVSRFYKCAYRTVRRHIKSGEPIKKLGIIIKYKE